jgi:hypothetical protein
MRFPFFVSSVKILKLLLIFEVIVKKIHINYRLHLEIFKKKIIVFVNHNSNIMMDENHL